MDPNTEGTPQGTPEELEQQQAAMDELLPQPGVEATEPVEEKAEGKETPKEESVEEKKEELVKEEKPKEKSAEEQRQDELAAENARLRQELNELAKSVGTKPAAPPVEAVPPVTPAVDTSKPSGTIEFISAEEAENLIDKPQEVLNAAFNRVFQAGRESVMREMPVLVRQQALTEMTMQQKVQKFWGDNADLEPYRDFCSMVANQVEIENPNMPFDEVLGKTAERARERLNIPKPEAGKVGIPPSEEAVSLTPALPQSPGTARRGKGPDAPEDPQQKEMQDILF